MTYGAGGFGEGGFGETMTLSEPPAPPSDEPSVTRPMDRTDVQAFIEAQNAPSYRAAYAQGDSWAVEDFEVVNTGRGAELVEMHFADGRYVTVRATEQLAWVAEAPK